MENLEKQETQEVKADAVSAKKKKTSEETVNDILEIAETVLVSVFVVMLLFTYLIRPVTVEGGSMFPTLHNNDRLLMYRFMYEPKVGDIVVINNQMGYDFDANGAVVETGRALHKNIIKRVIAVGGQQVDIDARNGVVYVDGVALQEDYINELTLEDDGLFLNDYPFVVPEGYIFVLGDNRNNSTDSRNERVGLVPEEAVMGKSIFCYYPFDQFGFTN